MNNAPTYNERTARALINELTTNGGCTLKDDGTHATQGYAVGLGGAEALDPKRPYFEQVLRIVNDARRVDAISVYLLGAVDCDSTAFGAWRDSETGRDYVEPIQILTDRATALTVAAERGELAIYDLTNGVEIRIGR